MSTTTMNEERTTEKPKRPDPLRSLLRAGLGLVAIAGEEGERLYHALVEKGKEVEPEFKHGVGAGFRGLKDTMSRGASVVDENVRETLRRMKFPTSDEIRDLNRKMDDLAAKLEELRKPRQSPPDTESH